MYQRPWNHLLEESSLLKAILGNNQLIILVNILNGRGLPVIGQIEIIRCITVLKLMYVYRVACYLIFVPC